MSFSKTIPLFVIILFLCVQCKKNDTLVFPLSAPDNWRQETIQFPLSFAPSIEHDGTLYVRFAPGWGKQDSEEYFSYIFLWSLDQNPDLSSTSLESQMESYFDGLMNMISKSDSKNSIKTKTFFEKIDSQSYAGKIITYDGFITKKEVSLNVVVTTTPCENLGKYLVTFRISPQDIKHPIWDTLNNVHITLNCN